MLIRYFSPYAGVYPAATYPYATYPYAAYAQPAVQYAQPAVTYVQQPTMVYPQTVGGQKKVSPVVPSTYAAQPFFFGFGNRGSFFNNNIGGKASYGSNP